MHRFFLPPEQCTGGIVTLGAADSRHASRVLRLRPGETIEVLDGAGRRLTCRLRSVDRAAVTAEVMNEARQDAPPRVTLAPAVLKGRAMDWLIQKATELGATAIRPVTTARTIVRLEPREAAERVLQWRVTAMEASKQCGNAWLPEIVEPAELPDLLADERCASGLRFAAMLGPGMQRPGEALASWTPDAGEVWFFTGPEGDYTDAERERLLGASVRPVTLGPLVLRAETAAIAGLAIVQHELARLASAA